MITVAFTVSCQREKYLRAALDSWARARGSDQARFVFCLEPPVHFPVHEFTAFVNRAFPGRALVYDNPQRLGCLRNTRHAMDVALGLSDDGFAVLAEEDLEVADDVIEYLCWARDSYRADQDVVAVCAHAKASPLQDASAAVRAEWFNPLVWGTWTDSWRDFIRPGWGPVEGNNEGWDRNLQLQIQAGGKKCVFPCLSRVIHKGETSTLTGYPLSEYFYRQFLSHCYSPHYEPQSYRELDNVPGLVV